MTSTRPLLRWAGSKRKLLPELTRYWSPHFSRYVEPFAGSACLYFRLAPRRALIGDINEELIHVYETLKKDAGSVARSLRRMKVGRDEYLAVRSRDPHGLSPAARAARFIYLNRFCFNGLWRTNQQGKFNVPYGGRRCGQLPTDNELADFARRLKNARFVAGDFEAVLKQTRLGDFVYMDPPFRVTAARVFTQYDRSAFSHSDLLRLRSWMERLHARSIAFLVSYAESEEATFLSEGFSNRKLLVRRNIAGFTARRRAFGEVLISNMTFGGGTQC
jgi:DNA adenine methylase